MFRFLTAILAIFLLSPAAPAFSQDNPIEAARAAGLYGVAPDFTTSLGSAELDEARRVVWEAYGVYFEEFNNVAFIAGLDPQGPAAGRGAKVGDQLRGNAVYGAYNGSLNITLRALSGAAEDTGPDAGLEMYMIDGDRGVHTQYTLVPRQDGAAPAGLPPAMRRVATHPGIVAVMTGVRAGAEPGVIGRDIFLALQAISAHPTDCIGPNGKTIAFTWRTEEVTRNGFGLETGRETTDFQKSIRVRPEFEPWVRQNIRAYPDPPFSTVRESVRDLISLEGCNGAGYSQLENGIAAMLQVSLPPRPEAEPQRTGAISSDWRPFVASCYPASLQAARARGQNPAERRFALVCVCTEHAARQMGDPDYYAALSRRDRTGYQADADLKNRFKTVFDTCFREREPADVMQNYEVFIRDNGI